MAGLRPTLAQQCAIKEHFCSFIQEMSFPCVGAKSAIASGKLKTLIGYDITSSWDDVRLQDELMEWAHEYASAPTLFSSFAMIFASSRDLSELAFERAMWRRLQSLANKDAWRGQDYDARVSPDPNNPHFSLSFGGLAFFLVGLHPRASRPARRFHYPTLVFNAHDQFEQLRADGKYERMRSKIVQRDVALAGSPNPMLARHGEVSEARQYSGRVVGDDWRCPFHDPRRA
jgi:FPC/CPF motif-containing protein YcgG